MIETLSSIFSLHGLLIGTIVPFLFVLTAVVFVHEMGHYLVGRWCGIGVKAFSIGFGPELFGFNDRRGTRWKLCAIPLGGYVKFVGDMNAVSQPDDAEMAALSDAERKVAFHTQPIWKRAATVFAGPLFNFLLTIAVLAVLFSIYGKVVLEPTVAEIVPDSPAAAAGFLPGDRFVSVDGQPVETFADVQRLVSGRAGDASSSSCCATARRSRSPRRRNHRAERRARQYDQGRRDRRRQQRGARPTARHQLQPGRRGRRGACARPCISSSAPASS